MKQKTFKAYEVREEKEKVFKGSVVEKHIDDLPSNDVLIKVHYSSINYKDALSAKGNKGVTKNYPHTPGIDAAGIVEESTDQSFKQGDKVIVTGYDLGMTTPGGFGEYISANKEWIVKLPKGLSLEEAMMYGTAGLTAALSVSKLVNHGVTPSDGEILVTGGTGGVGSVAISILSKLGYSVIASTGKASKKELLTSLGAKDIILREELTAETKRPLLRPRWAGIIDTVGGLSLVNGLKALKYEGCATCCGNVAGHTFLSSIYPFIIKGVTLYGIDSVEIKNKRKKEMWDYLATNWNVVDKIETSEVTIDGIDEKVDAILAGKHTGRTIIKHV